MTVRLSDLPKATRTALAARAKGQGVDVKAEGAKARKGDRGGPIRCHGCRIVFPQYGGRDGWEAHSKGTPEHRRAEVIW